MFVESAQFYSFWDKTYFPNFAPGGNVSPRFVTKSLLFIKPNTHINISLSTYTQLAEAIMRFDVRMKRKRSNQKACPTIKNNKTM